MRLSLGLKQLITLSIAGALLVPSFGLAASEPTQVILLTLDGVRWEEVFESQRSEASPLPFENLRGPLAREGVLLGDRKSSSVEVSNIAKLSLPGYQNIFTGHPTRCFSNHCKRVREPTFPEHLKAALNLSSSELAGFASWENIKNAYSQKGSDLFLNAGAEPSGLASETHQAIDHEQKSDLPPWNGDHQFSARYDRYTFAHGLTYLKENQPKFLYISLLDADQYAHAGDRAAYLQTLRQYDLWIKKICETLDAMGDYGRNTLLIVTTDHGRGKRNWRAHGMLKGGSGKIWMFLRGKGVQNGQVPEWVRNAENNYSHDSVRPLIEGAFGLSVTSQASE